MRTTVTTTATRTLAVALALAIAGASALTATSSAVAAVPTAPAAVIPLDGAGTAQSPYQIDDEDDFRSFILFANATEGGYAASSYLLTSDIVLNSNVDMIQNFTGALDGGGHSVFGLSVNFDATKTNKTAALMNANRGTISKIGFVDVAVTGSPVGQESATLTKKATIAANNYGTVDQVYVQGTVSGGWRTGGIVADNFGTVSNSYFSGTVAGNWETGAIVARNDNAVPATVTKNYAMATVSTITNNIGIISGYAYANTVTTSNVAYSGSVTGAANLGRINGQLNGVPKFSNNLGLDSITLNGATTTGSITDRNGQATSKATLGLQKTYTDIGWDFTTIWAFDAAKARPVLRAVAELKVADIVLVHESEVIVESPDGKTKAVVFVDQFDHLGYQVLQNGKVVVKDSRLGLVIDAVDYGINVGLGDESDYSNDESYSLIGTHSTGTDTHNGSVIPVTKGGTSALSIDVRVFDTGIALQYVLDSSLAGKKVTKETTTFTFDPASMVNYQNVTATEIDDLQNVWSRSTFAGIGSRQITVLPTIELPDAAAFINVAEANIRDWPALALNADSTGAISTYYWATDNGQGTFAVAPGTLHSPWRVLTIADNLNDFSNSDIITNVSDPVDEEEFADADDWITPGVSVWMPQNGVGFTSTPKDFRTFIDASSKVGIEYVTVEEISDPAWGSTMAQKFATLRSLVDYGLAKDNPVRVWLWSDYDFGNGTDQAFIDSINYTSPLTDKDSLVNPDFRAAYLDLVKATGIDGLKIDHIGNETETKVNFYGDFLVSAAERQMMVIYHNPLAPSGLNRTYPNELGREAIRGVQYNYDATLNTIMPFTRLVAGVADYTPLTFSNTSKLNNVTWTNMLASTIIYSSPYLQVSEVPTTMVEGAKFEYELNDFIQNVPTTWKSSEVLPASKIGSLAAFVRHTDDNEWYVAAQAAAGATQNLAVDLSFLPAGVSYNADVYSDSTVAASLTRKTMVVDSTSTLSSTLSSGGGYVVRITTKKINNPLADPVIYTVNSEADLELIRSHPTGTFEFGSDIRMTQDFTPIPSFRGEIHGNGFEITNLVVGGSDATSKAFIVDNSGTITQLGFSNAKSTRTAGYVESVKVAAVVVTNRGLVDQVYVVDSTVNGGWRTAGIVAENYGTISNSYATGSVVSNWEAGAVVAWSSATAHVINTYADATVSAVVNNAGVVSGYGYAGTEYTGNVALGGSVAGVANIGRVNGRENGTPTYSKNLSLASVTVNGQVVTGSLTDKNGRDTSTDDLARISTFEAIGWDFEKIWTYNDLLDRPVLRNSAEIDAPVVNLTTNSLNYFVGDSPTRAEVIAAAGISTNTGELELDLSGVEYSVPGDYEVEVGASYNGAHATVKILTIFVEANVAPVVTLGQADLVFQVGDSQSRSEVLDAAGITIDRGELQLDLDSVDYNTVGEYSVDVRGSYRDAVSEPRQLTITVVPVIVITAARESVSVPYAAVLTESELLSDLGITLNVTGTVSADITGITTSVAGSYPLVISARDEHGFAAVSKTVTVVVEPKATEPEPATTSTVLIRTKGSQVYGSTAVVQVSAAVTSAVGSPEGTVEFFRGTSKVATGTIVDGVARYSLPKTLPVGKYSITATFTSATADHLASTSAATTVAVTKAVATATVKIADRSLSKKQKAKATITVSSSTKVPVAGVVRVYDGAKRITSVTLKASAKGTVAVTLPKLKKGSHQLSVVFIGSTTVAADTSPRVKVKAK